MKMEADSQKSGLKIKKYIAMQFDEFPCFH